MSTSASADPGNPFDVAAGHDQAPFGDAMPGIVRNYLRAAPYIGTGGVVRRDGFAELKRLGFKTIINLQTAEEGAAHERLLAEQVGLTYVHMPVDGTGADETQVRVFAHHAENPENYPILLHCASANRVGALWALYRAYRGVPVRVAIEEGRTVGMRADREALVRQRLGADTD